jgi:hypothetical protein
MRRKWLTIPKRQRFTISRHGSLRGGFLFHAALRLIEIARVLVRTIASPSYHFVIAVWNK